MNARLPRRLLTAVIAAVLLGSTGCTGDANPNTSPSGGLTKVTVLTAIRIQGQDAPWAVGEAKGFFRERGIDLTIVAGQGTGDNIAALESGAAQFVIADLNALALIYDGRLNQDPRAQAPWVGIAAIYQQTISAIAAHPDAGITTVNDLEGKTVGYQEGGVNKTLFPAVAGQTGVDDNAIKWVPLGDLRGALVSRKVDAVTDNVTGIPVLRRKLGGREPVMLTYSTWLTDGYSNTWTTSRDLLARDPDLVRRFRDAAMESLVYAIDHPGEAADALAAAEPTYDRDTAAEEITKLRPYVYGADGVGTITGPRFNRGIASMAAIGVLKHQSEITVDSLVDPTIAVPYTP